MKNKFTVETYEMSILKGWHLKDKNQKLHATALTKEFTGIFALAKWEPSFIKDEVLKVLNKDTKIVYIHNFECFKDSNKNAIKYILNHIKEYYKNNGFDYIITFEIKTNYQYQKLIDNGFQNICNVKNKTYEISYFIYNLH